MIKKDTTEAFCLWRIIMEKNHLPAANAALEAQKIPTISTDSDSQSSLKSMSSGVLGEQEQGFPAVTAGIPQLTWNSAPWIKTFLHASHFCLEMEIKISE